MLKVGLQMNYQVSPWEPGREQAVGSPDPLPQPVFTKISYLYIPFLPQKGITPTRFMSIMSSLCTISAATE